jgi:diguanylate cyclase (GGDEF)-like protein
MIKKHFTVRDILLGPNIIIALLILILTTSTLFYYIDEYIEKSVVREHLAYIDRISSYINNKINYAEQKLLVNRSLFEIYNYDLESYETRLLFHKQLLESNNTDYLYYTNNHGQILSVGRDGNYGNSTKINPLSFRIFKSINDTDPNDIKPLMDFREKDWYKNAARTDEVVWTAPYLGEQVRVYGISASLRVLNQNQLVQGVLGVDILLDELQHYLKQLNEVEGSIISISAGKKIISASAEHLDRTILSELSTFKNNEKKVININEPIAITFDSVQYIVLKSNLRIISQDEWTLTTMIPQQYFESYYKDIKFVIIVFNVSIIIILFVINLVLSNYLVKEIHAFSSFFNQLKLNNWKGKMKSYSMVEFNNLANSINNLITNYDKSTEALKSKKNELKEINENVSIIVKKKTKFYKDLSNMDPLTGAFNRRYLVEFSGRLIDDKKLFSIAHLDIDYFKSVNDLYGHGIGDEVLVEFVDFFKSRLRRGDIIVRSGGEEFILVLCNTELEDALKVVNRYKSEMSEIAYSSQKIIIKFSAGIAQYQDGKSLDDLLKVSDEALYIAKREGRDQVRIIQ